MHAARVDSRGNEVRLAAAESAQAWVKVGLIVVSLRPAVAAGVSIPVGRETVAVELLKVLEGKAGQRRCRILTGRVERGRTASLTARSGAICPNAIRTLLGGGR